MSKKFFIIDGSAYIFRAFYAIRASLSNSKGLPTNAVYGFARMLLKVLREERPEYCAMVFDARGKTTRHAYFPEYKANRSSMPEDLAVQIPYIHELVRALNIGVLCLEGIEADDIIGSLALQSKRRGFEVTIVSGDKDMMQLVSESVTMLDTMKDKRMGPREVREKIGVGPEKVIEIMGLTGDASDNIPGVPGIGPKTALELIREYDDIENTLAHAGEIKKKSVRERLLRFTDQARLSRRLVTIDTGLELPSGPADFRIGEINREAVVRLLKDLEFASLLGDLTLPAAPEAEREKNYRTVLRWKDFEKMLEELMRAGSFALDLETTSKHPVEAKIVGISFACRPHHAFYCPLAHQYPGCPAQLGLRAVLERLKPVLENPEIGKFGQNIKYEKIVLKNAGIDLKGIAFDTMIASYLLEPNKRNHNLNDLALEYLNHKMIPYKDVAGTGAGEIGFHQVAIPAATEYSCEDADITFLLTRKLGPMIDAEGLEELFRGIEMPLVEVLAEMEMNGVGINRDFLREMSGHLDSRLNALTENIHTLAGEEFNINSPKQLSTILFEKLGLPSSKKTKSGLSTNEAVLEGLADKHELPAVVLQFRRLKKLKSTYLDALPEMVNPLTNRVHTSFNQTVAATGRLSSANPNLQNIPVQTEIGREVRKAFVPDKGSLLLSADYSQIELRILAHLSGDEFLAESFLKGEDIHAKTASEVFHCLPGMVTPAMRRTAKAVNFGIIYGISAFGLAKQIGVSRKEAGDYIDGYFRLYKKVREYLDQAIARARTDGFVTTLMGRRRPIPELAGPNKAQREFGERMAVNSPIQGSAADLIKMAMIAIAEAMKRDRLASRMILQVHDELVFEVPEAERKIMEGLVRNRMEGVYPLTVPLTVDLRFGKDWEEAH